MDNQQGKVNEDMVEGACRVKDKHNAHDMDHEVVLEEPRSMFDNDEVEQGETRRSQSSDNVFEQPIAVDIENMIHDIYHQGEGEEDHGMKNHVHNLFGHHKDTHEENAHISNKTGPPNNGGSYYHDYEGILEDPRFYFQTGLDPPNVMRVHIRQLDQGLWMKSHEELSNVNSQKSSQALQAG